MLLLRSSCLLLCINAGGRAALGLQAPICAAAAAAAAVEHACAPVCKRVLLNVLPLGP